MTVTTIVLWFLFSAITGMVAATLWERNAVVWFLVALLISPLLAVVILIAAGASGRDPRDAERSELGPPDPDGLLARLESLFDSGRLTLSQLARLKALAERELPPAPTMPTAPVSIRRDDDRRTRACPQCGGAIHVKATTCMHCWAKVAATG